MVTGGERRWQAAAAAEAAGSDKLSPTRCCSIRNYRTSSPGCRLTAGPL